MEALTQARDIIEKSQTILVMPSENSQGDILASSLALFSTLKKLNKNVNILTKSVPEKFRFLSNIQPQDPKSFVISVNTAGKDISEMRYEKNEDTLKVYLALSQGELESNDISLSTMGQKPDLLITLGVKTLEDMGGFFEQNPKFFYETIILNIDNHPSNDNFGQINLVDVTTSLSEIITDLIKLMEKEGKEILDKDIATQLLTGVISASQNFRNSRTRPQTFQASAYLIEKGGDHQKIVQQLYKQKSVAQINLLGKILEKMDYETQRNLYSTSLTEQDFKECNATSKDLSFVVEELKFNFQYLPNLLILWESRASNPVVKGIFYSQQPELINKIVQNYSGEAKGEGVLFVIQDNNLASAKDKLLNLF
ncbi:MAG: DHH family phosphoesterase [Candidatus Nealsonbacteria bacterium]